MGNWGKSIANLLKEKWTFALFIAKTVILNGTLTILFGVTMVFLSEGRGSIVKTEKKNLRRISIVVTAQTKGNLERLAAVCGYSEIGRVVDKLTREKMISLHDCERKEKHHE